MNIIPFDAQGASTAIAQINQAFRATAKDLVGNSAGAGFPVVSIKGKVFHIQRGDEKTLVTKPGEDDPAASIEVVIVRANPNRSKVYYKGGYVEGSVDKPMCSSNDGVKPSADAAQPQSKTCAVCPHNQWGSKITESGAKGKSCSDSRRLAIATADAPADPMLLRVPAASMKNLEEYGKMLDARGVSYQAVVTRVGFDYTVAYPSLSFKPVGLIGEADTLRTIQRMQEAEIVRNIIGLVDTPATQEEANGDLGTVVASQPTVANVNVAAPAVAAPAPRAKVAAKPAVPAVDPVDAAVAAANPAKKATVKVEVAASESLDDQISSMLAGLSFDDDK
jgi:hypothetical protein